MKAAQQVSQWSQIVAKAWEEDDFKARLVTKPRTILREFGIQVPDSVQLRVLENTDQVFYFPLPAKPRQDQLLTDEFALTPWGQVVAKAWQDKSFKSRLLDEPATILKEHGVELPANAQPCVVENTDQVAHLVLPAKPSERELSDKELEGVAGGVVTIEYLVLGTFLALALIVGVTAVSSDSTTKSTPLLKSR